MYTPLALTAVLFHAVTAAPVAQWTNQGSSSSGAAPLKSGNPFSFPLPNGFDGQLSGTALTDTSQQALGIPPNGPAPTLDADGITSVQLIAFNEIWEVAFFTDLLSNVTNSVSGFTPNDNGATKAALTAIQAVEELHATSVNDILTANKKDPIQPCQYYFPTTDLASALALAKTFTDVVVGTLQDIQLRLASNGEAGLVPILGSVIGNEGEQTGYFRTSTGLVPTSKPFLTRATREFAFSALNQMFVVPGSCPNSNEIDLPVFEALTVTTKNIQAADQTLSFSVSSKDLPSTSGLSIVYINGQSVPVVEQIKNVSTQGGVTTFQADFPFSSGVMDGLTIAALTTSSGPFSGAPDVAKVTFAGPGLIEIN